MRRPGASQHLIKEGASNRIEDLQRRLRAPRQRITRELLKDCDRGLVRGCEARPTDDESLFQGVLAAQAGMAGAVGENDPCRAGGKLPAVFATSLLKAGVFLHGVVNLEHKTVVSRTSDKGQAQTSHGLGRQVFPAAHGALFPIQSDPLRKLACQGLKVVRRKPDPLPFWVNVSEDPQQSITVRRARGE